MGSNADGSALWVDRPWGRPHVASAPRAVPGPGEVLVEVRAVAVNPVDGAGPMRVLIAPWLRYPTVLGSDVSGVVIAAGPGVERFAPGDRVLGHAGGLERSRNRPQEGGFQTHVVLLERVVAPLPDALAFAEGAVLPLALSTAAAGLFEEDQLALRRPSASAPESAEVVVVWGGSTSVGMNAIQLARGAGYRVIATASPRNHALLERLGAESVVDYRDPAAPGAVSDRIADRRIAGIVAIGAGSLPRTIRIARRSGQEVRIASAHPTPLTRLRARVQRRHGIRISAIWGGTPIDSPVGPAVYVDYLPAALASGRHLAVPEPDVIGEGLPQVPVAIRRLRRGVSARKVVVTLRPGGAAARQPGTTSAVVGRDDPDGSARAHR